MVAMICQILFIANNLTILTIFKSTQEQGNIRLLKFDLFLYWTNYTFLVYVLDHLILREWLIIHLILFQAHNPIDEYRVKREAFFYQEKWMIAIWTVVAIGQLCFSFYFDFKAFLSDEETIGEQ